MQLLLNILHSSFHTESLKSDVHFLLSLLASPFLSLPPPPLCLFFSQMDDTVKRLKQIKQINRHYSIMAKHINFQTSLIQITTLPVISCVTLGTLLSLLLLRFPHLWNRDVARRPLLVLFPGLNERTYRKPLSGSVLSAREMSAMSITGF